MSGALALARGRTLTSEEANAMRNTICTAVHDGPVMELV